MNILLFEGEQAEHFATVDVEGSEKTGFLYNVSWFDNTFIHELECTQKTYDATMVDHMITWAKKHDQ